MPVLILAVSLISAIVSLFVRKLEIDPLTPMDFAAPPDSTTEILLVVVSARTTKASELTSTPEWIFAVVLLV